MPPASPMLEGMHPVAVPSSQKWWEDTAAPICTHFQSPQGSSIRATAPLAPSRQQSSKGERIQQG